MKETLNDVFSGGLFYIYFVNDISETRVVPQSLNNQVIFMLCVGK